MKISELIIRLQEIQEQYGDLDCVDVLGDSVEVELGFKTKYGVRKYRKSDYNDEKYVCMIL